MTVPLHAALPLHEIIATLEREAELRANTMEILTVEVRRIAKNRGPADDFEAAVVRRFIEESERVN